MLYPVDGVMDGQSRTSDYTPLDMQVQNLRQRQRPLVRAAFVLFYAEGAYAWTVSP